MSAQKSGIEAVNTLSPLQKAALAVRELRTRLNAVEGAAREPIAIIGMGCRFPQADGLDAYWHLLAEGIDAITEVPKARWDLEQFFDANPNAAGKINTRYGGFIDDVAGFDAAFFGVSPHEAERMDPQQRILLEVSWHALEDAGLAPAGLRGSSTGVFVGMTQTDYGVMQLGGPVEDIQAYTGTGNGQCFAAGRIAYALGLNGPTFAVDTACSSSLVALHQACQALRNRECDNALVAGAHLNLTPPMQIFLSKTQSFAVDGRCRTFDDSANGFVLGEGVGVVVLRRLSDALARGDSIRAVIRGSGINHDGPASGLTVPSESAQEALIRSVYERARLNPADIDYVEAHGTATQLGDPIEVGALRSVFGQRTPAQEALWLGSVKTNFGHLNAAAGIAGLIKVVLMLQHEQIAPNLHFKQPSSRIPWDGFSVRVPTTLQPWPRHAQRPRRAAVSSFGLSGTNTHVVLEEAPQGLVSSLPVVSLSAARPWHLFCLSARSEQALRALAQTYSQMLNSEFLVLNSNSSSDIKNSKLQNGGLSSISDVCFSANGGRNHFAYRLALRVDSIAALREGLTAFLADTKGLAPVAKGGLGRIAFSMGESVSVSAVRELALTQPHVAATLARCDSAYGVGLFALPETENPVQFACQFALASMWQSWGVRSSALSGSGIGSLTALCLAGALDLEQAFAALAGQAVDARALEISLYSATDGKLQPFTPQPGYRVSAPFAVGDEAARALSDAGFKTILGIGDLTEAQADGVLAGSSGSLWPSLLDTLAGLYRRGLSVDWAAFDAGYAWHRVRLPTYPFQHEHFWLERLAAPAPVATPVAAPAPAAVSGEHDLTRLLGAQLDAVTQSINEVVAQQLVFLRGRMSTQAGNLSASDLVPQPAPRSFALGEWHLLLLAAKDESALAQLNLSLAREGCVGEGTTRAMLVYHTEEERVAALGQSWAERDQKCVISAVARADRSLVFMFPGVGDHYLNMAQGLYANEAVFRATVDECCDFLQPLLQLDLREVLYPASTPRDSSSQATKTEPAKKPDLRAMLGRGAAPIDPAETRLNQTLHSQPLVFIVEYALGRMWQARGVQPHAMIGYSIGEYACACLAGVVSVQDALTLITHRAQMIQALPHGVMLAVPLPEARVLPLLGSELSLCIVSTPAMCVVGGQEAAVAALETRLRADEVVSRRLPGTHAFHSRMLESLHAPLVELIKGFKLHAPQIPYLSNLTGDWISAEQATDPTYWARHTWQTVHFAEGLGRLLETEGRVFLEVGPGQSLGSFVLQHPSAAKLRDKVVLSSLRNRYERQPDEAFFLTTLGKLWLSLMIK